MCIEVQRVFDLKIKFNGHNSSQIKELTLLNKDLKVDLLKRCVSNLTQFIYINKVELQQVKDDQINLYDLNNNRTHDSKDFCIDTQYDASKNWSRTFVKICHSFCIEDSNTCIPYCCPKGRFLKVNVERKKSECVPYKSITNITDWRPEALKNTQEIIPLYDIIPKCSDSAFDSYSTNYLLNILENGNLERGKNLK